MERVWRGGRGEVRSGVWGFVDGNRKTYGVLECLQISEDLCYLQAGCCIGSHSAAYSVERMLCRASVAIVSFLAVSLLK